MAVKMMTREQIEALNERARQIADESAVGISAVAACEQAADEAGLIVVIGDNQTTLLLHLETGEIVNLWTDGPMSTAIEDGGVGFDDQVDTDNLVVRQALGIV